MLRKYMLAVRTCCVMTQTDRTSLSLAGIFQTPPLGVKTPSRLVTPPHHRSPTRQKFKGCRLLFIGLDEYIVGVEVAEDQFNSLHSKTGPLYACAELLA